MAKNFWASCGIAVLLLITIVMVEAQDTECLTKLAPCLSYLNGTRNPPDNCCDPLKSVIKSNPKCLCSLISNNSTKQAEKAGINVNEAQQLPGRCGQHVNPLSCLSSSPTSSKKESDENSGSSLAFSSHTTFFFIAFSFTLPILSMFS